MHKSREQFLKRGIVSLILLVLSVLSFKGITNNVFIDKTFLSRIDRGANAYLDDALKKALITYAVVRGLNAVVSVVQESDVAVSPAGIGISVAVGEMLDPINDLIERFSWIVLTSTTSLGIQKFLLQIGKWAGFEILLSIALFMIAFGLWLPPDRIPVRKWGYRILILAFIVRFTVPVMAIATDSIDGLFLRNTYEKASASLDTAGSGYSDDERLTERDNGLGTRIRNFFENMGKTIQLEEKIRDMKNTLTLAVDHIVDLMIVFLMKTILIPVVILWIFLRLAGKLFQTQLPFAPKQKAGKITGQT